MNQYLYDDELDQEVYVQQSIEIDIADVKNNENLTTGQLRINQGFFCNICHKTLSSNEKHQCKHSGNLPFECDQCGKKFDYKPSLKRHVLLFHNAANRFTANTSQKRYKCDLCNRKFTHKNTLKDHYNIHTGEKPYSCDLCDMKFSWSGNRFRHVKICKGK